MKIKYWIPILLVVFIFSFTACTIPKTATETTIAQTAVTETMPPETTVAETILPEATVAETTTTLNKDSKLFLKAIEKYDPIQKALEYATIAYDILLEAVKAENMTNEEKGNKYMDLARKIGSDYFSFNIIKLNILENTGIKKITDDMKNYLDLIDEWSDKEATYYEYTAKHYYGEGAEYEIKANELEEEIQDITDKYIELREQILR